MAVDGQIFLGKPVVRRDASPTITPGAANDYLLSGGTPTNPVSRAARPLKAVSEKPLFPNKKPREIIYCAWE